MSDRKLKIVFFGTAEFAVPSLEALVKAGHTVLAVVSQPDKPQGRGRQLAASPVKQAALALGLPVLQPKRVRREAFIAEIAALAPDLMALAAFGQVIPQALLDIPPLGPINVHGSLLPKYRGAAPIQRAIMQGEAESGVTTMWMDATLDTGDILLKESLPIGPNDTAGDLTPKLAGLGAQLLLRTIEGLTAATLHRTPQDNSQATLAPALLPEDGEIRWTETAQKIHNRVRGVSPRPGAYTFLAQKRVKVWRTALLEESSLSESGVVTGFSKKPAGLIVTAGAGTQLLLTEVQPENGKHMAADAWARGARILEGVRFGSETTINIESA